MSTMPHKGTYSRGYLPHRDYPGALQAITFRLADSVPAKVIASWRSELSALLESADTKTADQAIRELHHRISRYEDTGHGACHLRNPEVAAILQNKLISSHLERYQLLAWCIMPNHVHVMIREIENHPLGIVVQGWKGGSAIEINRMLGRSGRLWNPDFHDRFIRDESHFYRCLSYIHQNPVKAGLCKAPEDWPFSSIGCGWDPSRSDREL